MATAESSPKRRKLGGPNLSKMETPLASFDVISAEDLARVSMPYSSSEAFPSALRKVLDDSGLVIVTGILNAEECSEFDRVKQRELHSESTQLGAMEHAQGEVAWKARLHPRVRELFGHVYGTTDLSSSVDLPSMFFTPAGAPAETHNDQWLHVDQNFHTGITYRCYQGVLYIHGSDANSSTTAAWPGSHLPAVYDRILSDLQAAEKGAFEDDSGVRYGQFLSINALQDRELRAELLEAALAGTRRLSVAAGSLLLWDSRTVHQGWRGGPRFAVPVCWEPRDRVHTSATLRKLLVTAAGVASSHSPSEGRVHPFAATRRGLSAQLRRPTVRPYAARPVDEVSPEAWEAVWADWPEVAYAENMTGTVSREALIQVLRPEVVAAL